MIRTSHFFLNISSSVFHIRQSVLCEAESLVKSAAEKANLVSLWPLVAQQSAC